MSSTEIAQIMTAISAMGAMVISAIGLLVSFLNRQKIDEVHRTTNSLAQRNEAIAKALGIKEGKEQGLREGRMERGTKSE